MKTFKNTYLNFLTEDFLTDEYFQDWARFPDSENITFWNEFILEYPEKKDMVENAASLLSRLDFVEHLPKEGQAQASFDLHLEKIEVSVQKAKVRKLRYYTKVAAIWFTAILSIGTIWYLNKYVGYKSYHNDFGQIQNLILPDGSAVMLQANSSIRYRKDWGNDAPREVTLDGEAFFKVKHLNTRPEQVKENEKFIVHAKSVDVQVLGTVFNVKERRGSAIVVLKSGKVRVIYKGTQYAGKQVDLKPGDLLNYTAASKQAPTVKQTNTDVPTAWTRGEIVFDGMRVQEVLNYLGDNYGYEIQVRDPEILDHQLTGSLTIENGYDLVFLLENILKVKMEQHGKILIISNRNK